MTLVITLIVLLLAVLGYVTAWFVVARLSGRTDVVDSAWGLGFVYVAWLAYAISQHHTTLKLIAVLFVSLWGVRLFAHIGSRNFRKSEDDYRYLEYRKKWQESYWQTAYLKIFVTQGVLLWVISLSTIAIMMATEPACRWLAVIGFVVWGFGIIFEAVGDYQLRQFIKTKKHEQIMNKGLWRYSRHPNYFGEVTSWWGAALVAISLQQWWGIIGALAITILITKVSGIPPLEKHYEGNKNFEKYKKHTSVFFPLPPR